MKTTTTQLQMAKSRKARRSQKVDKSRPKSFYDAIDDAQQKQQKQQQGEGGGGGGEIQNTTTVPSSTDDPFEVARKSQMEEAQRRMDARPEVSTIIVDEETGEEFLQQGKNVMDVITRKPIKLSSLGPEYRLAQMFPGVPFEIRNKYRFNDPNAITVPEMVEALRRACTTKIMNDDDGSISYGIPTRTSVANKAIDFVLANRDLLGQQMAETLTRLSMRSYSLGNREEGKEYSKLCKNFYLIENYISAPFRQIILNAEGKAGPNFGNLDVQSYLDGDLYERTANYLVLKGMEAHWKKKLIDADLVEKTPMTKENFITVTSIGDPRRYLPDPPILYTLKECTQVYSMSQQMLQAFVNIPELFNDLPLEVKFLEYASSIQGGTALRKYMKEEFCPKNDITPVALIEGMKRLMQQFQNMQIDPYADIRYYIQQLIFAMSQGTNGAINMIELYYDYLYNIEDIIKGKSPGSFQTYTFDYEEQSLVRFLDNALAVDGDAITSSSSSPSSSIPMMDYKETSPGVDDLFANLLNMGNNNNNNKSPSSNMGEETSPSGNDDLFANLFNMGNNNNNNNNNNKSPFLKGEQPYVPPAVRSAGRPHSLGWIEQLWDDDDEMNKHPSGKQPVGRIITEEEEQE